MALTLPKIVYPMGSGTAITAATNANPCVLTVPIAPPTGTEVGITGGTGAWAGLNGTLTSTKVDATHFSVAVNSGGFGAVTGILMVNFRLYFQHQPRLVPINEVEATRHDLIASSGVIESIWERTDTFFEFTMEWVLSGGDALAWNHFVAISIQGQPFDYYPDYTLGAFTTYRYEDTKWKGDYKSLGMYNFPMLFRLRVGWP